MIITVYGEKLDFHEMEFVVLEQGMTDLFASFDKKTLGELVQQKQYENVKHYVEQNVPQWRDLPAGAALKKMKEHGYTYYKQFLNNYGDLTYSRFQIEGDLVLLKQHGIYTIIVDDELMFCGVCAKSFKERFNQHIGSIYAKGCFRDGTATNCHINAHITQKLKTNNIIFAVYPMTDTKEMNRIKNAIIKRFEPEWNLRVSSDLYEVTGV